MIHAEKNEDYTSIIAKIQKRHKELELESINNTHTLWLVILVLSLLTSHAGVISPEVRNVLCAAAIYGLYETHSFVKKAQISAHENPVENSVQPRSE
jgi:hypothetical protein